MKDVGLAVKVERPPFELAEQVRSVDREDLDEPGGASLLLGEALRFAHHALGHGGGPAAALGERTGV